MARQRRKASEALAPILEAGRALKVADLAEELVSAIGGTAAFAKLYASELTEGTKPGSVSRARMLDGILRIVAQSSAQQKGMERPEDQLSDAELQAIAHDYFARLAGKGDPVDGS